MVSSTIAALLVPVAGKAQALLGGCSPIRASLEKDEKVELVAQLRDCVEQAPRVSELRVLFGMALCVNLEAQDAMEELGEAVSLAPDSFIAHLKMGELWMRLRVCDKAEDHTQLRGASWRKIWRKPNWRGVRRPHSASMMRNGIERNGYRKPWLSLNRLQAALVAQSR